MSTSLYPQLGRQYKIARTLTAPVGADGAPIVSTMIMAPNGEQGLKFYWEGSASGAADRATLEVWVFNQAAAAGTGEWLLAASYTNVPHKQQCRFDLSGESEVAVRLAAVALANPASNLRQIGRASCRERV